jgi:hypothetical protein
MNVLYLYKVTILSNLDLSIEVNLYIYTIVNFLFINKTLYSF